ncbi:MAG: permease [Dehalococcoidia bacterium]
MLLQFFIVLKDYLIEVLPYLVAGLLLSGFINEFVPSRWVEAHLGKKGIKPLAYSAMAGTVLPICCIGSLPVAVSLHQKGARLGAVLAFLVATPATSLTALLVTYGLLGLKFTIFIFFSVIAIGLVMGLVGNLIKIQPRTCAQDQQATDPVCGMTVQKGTSPSTEYGGEMYYFCCPHCQQEFESNPQGFSSSHSRSIAHRAKHALRYGFVDMVRDIGPHMLLGLVLAALVAAITPVGNFVGAHLGGGLGYLFSLVFGILMYICSTASVPLVHAFVAQGLNIGAGMVLLLVGPVTSWSTILVLRKEFGNVTLLVYLAVISVMSLALGFCFSLI